MDQKATYETVSALPEFRAVCERLQLEPAQVQAFAAEVWRQAYAVGRRHETVRCADQCEVIAHKYFHDDALAEIADECKDEIRRSADRRWPPAAS